ncbi:uncharacterized protein LOC105831128 [Monomorium pharaonis]|uniref:uncharacterized protein LOC105831128 n=1 Tax=Monomorium pharaonis TaxID=307658 RepID=UPI001747672A|nr:uncharacterized protein LOC105831128 [Monomorium pharaonis]
MKTYAANGKRIFYVYSGKDKSILFLYKHTTINGYFVTGMIYLAVMFCFLIVPLIPKALDIVLPLNESRPASLPYEANYFVDSDKYYYFIILHIFVCLEILATLVIAKDNIVLGCIQHVCSIFTVAGHRFDVVSRYSDNNSTNSLHAINMYNKKIALSVYAHQQALRFVDLLEDTFCYPSLIHMFIIVVALTFTLMMLAVKFDDQIIDVPRKTIVLLCLLSQIFYYCMQGQRLIDHSEEAREKIYNSSWYNIPPKSQKMLLFVMLTNMEPNTITAGKIFTFSLETFARVSTGVCQGIDLNGSSGVYWGYVAPVAATGVLFGIELFDEVVVAATAATGRLRCELRYAVHTKLPERIFPGSIFAWIRLMSKNQISPVPANSTSRLLIDVTRNEVISRELTMYSGFIAMGHIILIGVSRRGVSDRSYEGFKLVVSAIPRRRGIISLKIMEARRHYYDIVYKISSLTGTWPYMKPRARIFRVALLTITMLTIFVPQIAYQFMCKTNIQCMCEAMTSYLLTFVALLKVYTFQLNIRTIKGLTQHLFVDWEGLEKTTKEYEIMKLYAENSRRFCLIYVVYCITAVFTFMSMSLLPFAFDVVWPLNESRPVLAPYPGYYFVDIQEYFFKIFWHSLIAWEIIMAGIVAHDCMFVTYVEHVCSMFAMVGFHFKNLFCNHDKAIKVTDDSNNTYCKKIGFFVHAHQEALRFAEVLEDTFTVPFAIQMLIVTLGISITLLQITQQDGDILESIRYGLYIFGQLIHLFFLSFEGQKLIDHSLQMSDKIYGSSWYEVSRRSQKLIMLVMMKSVRPACLSAGKIYIFSLESFTTVLQTSMSYFTVLASVQ